VNKFVRYIATHYTLFLFTFLFSFFFILYYFTMSFPVNFININLIINRFFRRAIRSKGIKTSFFTKSSFSKEKIDVIINEIFFDINK